MNTNKLSSQTGINTPVDKDAINDLVNKISFSIKNCKDYDPNINFRIAAKTAITRKGICAPLKTVHKLYPKLIRGNILNFGKGKSNFDSDFLSSIGETREWDFVYANYPAVLLDSYSTIACNYVLNVLPPKERDLTLKHVFSLLKEDGLVIFSVRSSKETALKKLFQTGTLKEDGVISKTGTFQRGFISKELVETARHYFEYVKPVKSSSSGFEIVIASHSDFNLETLK